MKRKIIIAKHAGFCWGVKRAVNMAVEAAKRDGVVYSLGELIHNPQEIKRLEKLGVLVAKSISDIPDGATVIIRSHGVPPQTISRLRERKLRLVDATCPFVKDVHEKAQSLESENYPVCILGNGLHPEVIGIAGYVKDPIIVESYEDIEKLPHFGRLGVVCQTTLSTEFFAKAISTLANKVKELKVYNTICKATKIRQEEAKRLASKVDVMLIVGGKNSSNTTKLYLLSKKINLKSFHIDAPDEIDINWFKGVETVGITAGASTPQWVIDEVLRRVEDILGGKKLGRNVCRTS